MGFPYPAYSYPWTLAEWWHAYLSIVSPAGNFFQATFFHATLIQAAEIRIADIIEPSEHAAITSLMDAVIMAAFPDAKTLTLYHGSLKVRATDGPLDTGWKL